jgi:hypothetical protein
MAARRERQRRSPPAERRYQVASSDALDAVDDAEVELFDGAPEMVPQTAPVSAGRSAPRATTSPARSSGAARVSGRPAARPFSAYRAEYAYVTTDLRRIVVVVGLLLVILIVLHFVIAR